MISIIDIVAVLVVGYAMYRGYKLGLIKIVFNFLAFWLAFYLTTRDYRQIGEFLQKNIHIRVTWSDALTWDNVLIYALAYVLFFVILILLGMLITRLFDKTILGSWNRYVGMGLNGIKWLVIIWIIVAFIMKLPFTKLITYSQKAFTYKTYRVVSDIVPVYKLFPEKLQK